MARKDKIETSMETPSEFQNPFTDVQIDRLPLAAGPETDKAGKPALGRVVLRQETHPGAKTVIVIHSFAASISNRSLQHLARKLGAACGCDGTIHQRTIQIKGNQLDKVRAVLEREGFCVAAG